MELSKRLFTVASLVTPGKRIVDIGTDHAYIPIYLIEEKKCRLAVAMDVNKGPLERAAEHIRNAGFQEKIETRLSDGFEKLKTGEADCAVIAGMGGGLVMRILSAYPEVTCSLQECILQPQSEIARVRAFLLENGFIFQEEDMVFDEGKYYPMMKVQPPACMKGQKDHIETTENMMQMSVGEKAGLPGESTVYEWTETELRYGKLLLKKKHPVLKDFLEREYRIQKQILDRIAGRQGEKIEARRRELQTDLYHIEKGMEYYAV